MMTPRPSAVRTLDVDALHIQVYATRAEMGQAAAYDVSARLRALLSQQASIRMVFAAAPSQNEFLAALGRTVGLDWSKVEAFHMDEYVGLPADAPQSFGLFLRTRLFDLARPGRVEYIDGNAPDATAECARYGALLRERPLDIVCAGIGENGHMAFNDPHVADFADPEAVKLVTLDKVCRRQQVHDGAFASVDQVPKAALTMTMPALMSAQRVYCIVPGPTKTEAVLRTLHGAMDTSCPASVMRRHRQAVLYLDQEAARRI